MRTKQYQGFATFLFFFLSQHLFATTIRDHAGLIHPEAERRIFHWGDRIQREFGVPVAIEIYRQSPKGMPSGKGSSREEDIKILDWANKHAEVIAPEALLFLVVLEGSIVAIAGGSSLTRFQELSQLDRRPIVTFLEQQLALDKPSEAFVGALRKLYHSLDQRLNGEILTSAAKENGAFSESWNALLPWLILGSVLTVFIFVIFGVSFIKQRKSEEGFKEPIMSS